MQPPGIVFNIAHPSCKFQIAIKVKSQLIYLNLSFIRIPLFLWVYLSTSIIPGNFFTYFVQCKSKLTLFLFNKIKYIQQLLFHLYSSCLVRISYQLLTGVVEDLELEFEHKVHVRNQKFHFGSILIKTI